MNIFSNFKFVLTSYKIFLKLFLSKNEAGGSMVVEQPLHQHKVKGLSPAPATGNERENGDK
jgi:hypothetical protein